MMVVLFCRIIALPTTLKAIRKPGKSGPAVFAFFHPGPPLRDFTKEIGSKAKPSVSTSPKRGSPTEGFAKPISSEPAPSHRPWTCALGATPVTELHRIISGTRPATPKPEYPNLSNKKDTCRIEFSAGKTTLEEV